MYAVHTVKLDDLQCHWAGTDQWHSRWAKNDKERAKGLTLIHVFDPVGVAWFASLLARHTPHDEDLDFVTDAYCGDQGNSALIVQAAMA